MLDIAEAAFADTRRRLPTAPVHYVAADVLVRTPERQYDLWHDRAVFHFLTDPSEQLAAARPPGTEIAVAEL